MSRNTGPAEAKELTPTESVGEQEFVYDDEEEVDEVIEEEVTDEDEEDVSMAPSSVVSTGTRKAPAVVVEQKKGKSPGRVVPSERVRNMTLVTPESKKKGGLSPDKNPFPAFGGWTESALDKIEISFPILTGKNETTNDLTRSSRPEARYWKAPIVFSYGNFTSETMRFDNVHIPFHTGKGYGSNYIYLCLPGFVGAIFADAGKKRAPTKVVESSLVPDAQRWWKIANSVEGTFGVINHDTKKFHPKSLETIFDATSSGISCSVILKFKCKASTTEKEPLKATTVRTVTAEVVRGYIGDVDVNVQMPTRISREKSKVDPVASSSDVATDALMKRLAELGL